MNREDIKSIKAIVENAIEKSVTEDLVYESSMKVQAKGSELKDKLKAYLIELVLDKDTTFKEMQELADSIGIMPSGVLDAWELKGLRSKLSKIPFKYSHSQIYTNERDDAYGYQPMKDYNSKLAKFIDLSIECLFLRVTINNIKDDKSYQLSVQLATKLGF